jgi:hypothetical protein
MAGNISNTKISGLRIFLTVITVLLLQSCDGIRQTLHDIADYGSGTGDSEPFVREPDLLYPSELPVTYTTKGWVVENNSIANYDSKLGELSVADKFVFNRYIYFKITSNSPSYAKFFWLLQVDIEKPDGIFHRTAKAFANEEETIKSSSPPKEIRIIGNVIGRTFRGHKIDPYSDAWGKFEVKEISKAAVCYIHNKSFPRMLWIAKLPENDGLYAVIFTRDEKGHR